jgi:hypothetical protein
MRKIFIGILVLKFFFGIKNGIKDIKHKAHGHTVIPTPTLLGHPWQKWHMDSPIGHPLK